MRRVLSTILPSIHLKSWGCQTPKRINRKGAATVEMAFVAPFVFFLIFGSVEFSRMMMMRQALTNAAREGCRHASLVTTQNDTAAANVVRQRLRGTMSNYNDPNVVRIECSPSFSTSPDSGTRITISAEVDCADVSWFPGSIFAGARIRGTSSMNRE